MRVGVVGLGLIGGSLAKTVVARTPHMVYGFDTDPAVLDAARRDGAVSGVLTDETLPACDLVAVALRPGETMEWLRGKAPLLEKNQIVFDCCGVKTEVCRAGFALASRYGFSFFGGHPMAGTERSGYAAARDGLFDGASMILVPPEGESAAARGTLQDFFLALGFGALTLTTAQEHDRTVAYTSQLAHVVSSAYVKSPTAQKNRGFSAGSFKDMTRVALLNERMWTELFLRNREALGAELSYLMERLREYENALRAGDETALCRLLREGRELKTLSEGRETP